MKYAYRWWYVSGMVLIIALGGYLFAVKPGLARIARLNKIENRLGTDLLYAKQLSASLQGRAQPKKISLPRTQTEWLSDLFTQVYLSGLIVQSLSVLPREPGDAQGGIVVKLKAQGHFPRLMAFVTALGRLDYPAAVMDFSYGIVEQDQFLFTARILMLGARPLHTTPDPFRQGSLPIKTPFCAAAKTLVSRAQDEKITTHTLPVRMLKMVGYFEQSERRQAILSLPGHAVVAVSLGEVLGKEGGRVTEIKPDQVLITLPDQQSIMLARLSRHEAPGEGRGEDAKSLHALS